MISVFGNLFIGPRGLRSAAVVFFGGTAILLLALAFEHIGGYLPCPLCLQERYAYYAGIPAGLFAVWLLRAGHWRLGALALLLLAAFYAANAGLGAYHAGVEWKFWPGPTDCTGTNTPLTIGSGDLATALAQPAIRCDEVSFRFLGLSFAGWNAVISAGLAKIATWGALRAWRV